ncbi:unnamed protein product [Acanthosepion pharaonis]|uniref:Uncharacterized protein n=1 Tax=Acanthosepion pharaonis TaxID=158019 RepID=A0A812ATB7_ACAPH|nr:unnamed protein product [Sepia pharaonis]
MRLYRSIALIRPRLQTRNVVTEQIPTSLAQAYIYPRSPVVTSSKSNTKSSKLKGQKIKLQMRKKEPMQQNYMKVQQTRKWQHAPSPLQQQNQQFVDVRLREEQLPESHLENGLLNSPIMKPPDSAILTQKSVGKLQTTNDLTKVQSAKAVPLKVFLFPNKIPSMPPLLVSKVLPLNNYTGQSRQKNVSSVDPLFTSDIPIQPETAGEKPGYFSNYVNSSVITAASPDRLSKTILKIYVNNVPVDTVIDTRNS